MEKRIIELKQPNRNYQCVVCCERKATTTVNIQRLVDNSNLIVFDVCDNCLSKMQQDIQKIYE